MLAVLLFQADSIDLGPLLDAIKAHAWVGVAMAVVGLAFAVLKRLGVLDKAPAPAPAPAKDDAQKAKDLLDGK